MVEDYMGTEHVSSEDELQPIPPEPQVVQIPGDPYQIASRLVSGEFRPEDVGNNRDEIIAELEALLPFVHGGIRGTVQYQMMRLQELKIEEEGVDEPIEEPQPA